MSNRRKNTIYSIVLLSLVAVVYLYRKNQATKQAQQQTNINQTDTNNANQGKTAPDHTVKVTGTTMGKIVYNVTYLDEKKRDLKPGIDSVLIAFNESLSTYIPDSEISKFNKRTNGLSPTKMFERVFLKSQEIYRTTDGAFDPTISPLINAWGFGFKKAEKGKIAVDSLLQFVGFDKYLKYSDNKITKSKTGIMLDFSAIAKGYAVDIVGEYLVSEGIKDYAVEIGGEVRCQGKNNAGRTWLFGVKDPQYKEKNRSSAFAAIYLDNKGMATSGNYENFYVKDGKKYAHTIDPKTGYPVEHSLLSASVLANDCMTADAYATAFMVMGLEKAKKILETQTDLEAFLIYADAEGKLQSFTTEGAKKYLAK